MLQPLHFLLLLLQNLGRPGPCAKPCVNSVTIVVATAAIAAAAAAAAPAAPAAAVRSCLRAGAVRQSVLGLYLGSA